MTVYDNHNFIFYVYIFLQQRFLQDKGYYSPTYSPDAGQIKTNSEELSSALKDFQQ